jgi:hypothetical protein
LTTRAQLRFQTKYITISPTSRIVEITNMVIDFSIIVINIIPITTAIPADEIIFWGFMSFLLEINYPG